MTENKEIRDNIGCLYKEIGNADDKYVTEMLDDGLAKKMRTAKVKKRRWSALACAAAIALVCAAAYPMMSDSLKTENDNKSTAHKSPDNSYNQNQEAIEDADDDKKSEENAADRVADEADEFGDMTEEETTDRVTVQDENTDKEMFDSDNSSRSSTTATNKTTSATASDSAQNLATGGDTVPWEEREIYEKYTILEGFGSVAYDCGGEISDDYVGEGLGNYSVFGYKDGKKVSVSCTVSAIVNVSTDTAVAVQYEGYAQMYYFISEDYSADTLGDLTADLAFDKILEQRAEGNGLISGKAEFSSGNALYEHTPDPNGDFSNAVYAMLNDGGLETADMGNLSYEESDTLNTSLKFTFSGYIAAYDGAEQVKWIKIRIYRCGYAEIYIGSRSYFFNIGDTKASELFSLLEQSSGLTVDDTYIGGKDRN